MYSKQLVPAILSSPWGIDDCCRHEDEMRAFMCARYPTSRIYVVLDRTEAYHRDHGRFVGDLVCVMLVESRRNSLRDQINIIVRVLLLYLPVYCFSLQMIRLATPWNPPPFSLSLLLTVSRRLIFSPTKSYRVYLVFFVF